MSDSKVAERLKSFIETKGLSYSQFADMCGIPRPSLSQLLTGRNKKINDIMVGQIHNMFPELSIVWLLFGEGPMEVSPIQESRNESDEEENFDEGLFSIKNPTLSDSKKIVFSRGGTDKNEILKENGLKMPLDQNKLIDSKVEILQKKIKELQGQIDNFKKNPRKAVQITVYYDDSTFETFFPR